MGSLEMEDEPGVDDPDVTVARAARHGFDSSLAGALANALAGALANARKHLLAERCAAGHWEGELSSSALSSATAVIALALAGRRRDGTEDASATETGGHMEAGLVWLRESANHDGGYGDTLDSPSNLATTALAWTALQLDEAREFDCGRAARAAADFLHERLGGVDAAHLARGLEQVYGEDKTFAVPILTACALGGALGEDPEVWRHIPTLPFELAALPRGFFRRIGLPVVSYALPALIAIGQVVHQRRGALGRSRLAWTSAVRALAEGRTLAVLESVQPSNGGFLEATPLTSFVVMSLVGCAAGRSAGATRSAERVIQRAGQFLRDSMRDDGSWPIDTNLATWGTTLAIGALGAEGDLRQTLGEDERQGLAEWLLGQQLATTHPYTGAAAGGWAWTDLPGGVPDADDTAGALLATALLAEAEQPTETHSTLNRATRASAERGALWLVNLQNRDGGLPTFCRGWTKLPFDQSCPDLTAHALRAWACWRGRLGSAATARIERASERAALHLVSTQDQAGAWTPLWFGNQGEASQHNPLYGTSRVLRAAGAVDASLPGWQRSMERGLAWLLGAQNFDGGFGGARGLPSTIEETALGLEGLADAFAAGVRCSGSHAGALESGALRRAAAWLVSATQGGTHFPTRPIGLYFAKLWYSERLYPIVFTVSALGRARALLGESHP